MYTLDGIKKSKVVTEKPTVISIMRRNPKIWNNFETPEVYRGKQTEDKTLTLPSIDDGELFSDEVKRSKTKPALSAKAVDLKLLSQENSYLRMKLLKATSGLRGASESIDRMKTQSEKLYEKQLANEIKFQDLQAENTRLLTERELNLKSQSISVEQSIPDVVRISTEINEPPVTPSTPVRPNSEKPSFGGMSPKKPILSKLIHAANSFKAERNKIKSDIKDWIAAYIVANNGLKPSLKVKNNPHPELRLLYEKLNKNALSAGCENDGDSLEFADGQSSESNADADVNVLSGVGSHDHGVKEMVGRDDDTVVDTTQDVPIMTQLEQFNELKRKEKKLTKVMRIWKSENPNSLDSDFSMHRELMKARQQLHNKEQFVKSLNETANVRMKLPQTTTDKNSFLLGLNDDVHNSIEQLNVEAQSIKVNRKKSATESTLNEEDLVKEIDKCTKSVENMKLLKANCEQSLEEMKHKRLTGDNVRTTDLLVKKLDMVNKMLVDEEQQLQQLRMSLQNVRHSEHAELSVEVTDSPGLNTTVDSCSATLYGATVTESKQDGHHEKNLFVPMTPTDKQNTQILNKDKSAFRPIPVKDNKEKGIGELIQTATAMPENVEHNSKDKCTFTSSSIMKKYNFSTHSESLHYLCSEVAAMEISNELLRQSLETWVVGYSDNHKGVLPTEAIISQHCFDLVYDIKKGVEILREKKNEIDILNRTADDGIERDELIAVELIEKLKEAMRISLSSVMDQSVADVEKLSDVTTQPAAIRTDLTAAPTAAVLPESNVDDSRPPYSVLTDNDVNVVQISESPQPTTPKALPALETRPNVATTGATTTDTNDTNDTQNDTNDTQTDTNDTQTDTNDTQTDGEPALAPDEEFNEHMETLKRLNVMRKKYTKLSKLGQSGSVGEKNRRKLEKVNRLIKEEEDIVRLSLDRLPIDDSRTNEGSDSRPSRPMKQGVAMAMTTLLTVAKQHPTDVMSYDTDI